jgi:hypothetical protein
VTHDQLVKSLQYGWPNTEWVLQGDTVDDLSWVGPGEKPTEEDVNAAFAEIDYDAIVASEREEAEASNKAMRSVTAAQAKLALYANGKLDIVEQAVAQYVPYKLFYDNSPYWQRNHPYVMGIGAELGLSEEEIDALFDAAALL